MQIHTNTDRKCLCVAGVYKLILGRKIFCLILRKYDKAAINLLHVIRGGLLRPRLLDKNEKCIQFEASN